MQRVHFCSGVVFDTGDAIAMALLGYARALAVIRRSDIVGVPAVPVAAGTGRVTLLLTATSQLSAEAVPADGDELLDPGFVDRMHTATNDLLMPVIWDGEP